MFVAELEGGTLTSSAGDMLSLLVRPASVGGERGGGVGPVVGTLLGPEGTGRSWERGWVFLLRRASCSSYRPVRFVGRGVRGWRWGSWSDWS